MSHCCLFPNWLKQQLDSQSYPGLVWEDECKTRFRIPWVKESQPGWDVCRQLFCDWVDRNSVGQERSKNKDVKQIFQSALRGSNYLILVGVCDKQFDSYRVYRFVSKEEGKAAKKKKSSCGNSQQFPLPQLTCKIGSNDEYPLFGSETRPHGIYIHNVFEHSSQIPCIPPYQPHVIPAENSNYTNMELENVPMCDHGSCPLSIGSSLDPENMEVSLSSLGITSGQMRDCFMNISYNGVEMKTHELPDMSNAYYVYYGLSTDIPPIPEEWKESFPNVQVIQLPEQDTRFADKNLASILENTRDGLLFWYDEKEYSIKMVRFCNSHVFRVDVQSDDPMAQEAEKLTRMETYELFSFKTLVANCNIHVWVNEDEPAKEFFVTIGVKPQPLGKGVAKKGIRLTFQHVGTLRYLTALPSISTSGPPCLSTEGTERMQCG